MRAKLGFQHLIPLLHETLISLERLTVEDAFSASSKMNACSYCFHISIRTSRMCCTCILTILKIIARGALAEKTLRWFGQVAICDYSKWNFLGYLHLLFQPRQAMQCITLERTSSCNLQALCSKQSDMSSYKYFYPPNGDFVTG